MPRSVFHTIACLALVSIAGAQDLTPEIRSGFWHGQPVTYQQINGRAIYQGDIILGHIDPTPIVPASQGPKGKSVGTAYSSYLWPKVGDIATVYYVIDPNSGDVSNINAAISQFNSDFTGVIQWVQRTNQTVYVDINLNGTNTGQCEAEEGYQPNFTQPQPMGGAANCTIGTLLHEMGHVVGLWHEQTRADRDQYVTVNYQNIIKGSRFNFDIIQDNIQNLGLYDYASVMQYPPFVQTRNGNPSLETIPPGMPLGSAEGVPVPATDYSAGDKEGILRLYGAPPTAITVASNPVGLTVIVDGTNYTTPHVFKWSLNSTHTLNVPANVQTVQAPIANSNVQTTYYYTYGRWNDNGAQSHTITVTPGNGDVPFPASGPQVATYTVNFIQLVPYSAVTFPANPVPGTVSIAPQPQSYPGVSGVFLTARQEATLTATPNSEWNLYEYNSIFPYLWLPGGLSANPKIFYVPDTGNPIDLNVEFTQSPVYTLDITPETFTSGLYAAVDGNFWLTPKNFSPDPAYDGSAWNPGTQHILGISTLQTPYSGNSRYRFSSWNVGGGQTPSVNLPSTNTSYVATVSPEYLAVNNFNDPPCGGTATLSPSSPTGDGFYPTGQILNVDATATNTWTFAGWTYDLTGTTNPDSLTANDETLVFANFNTTTTPLTLTSLNPAAAVSGGATFTLTLTGTGFSAGSIVAVVTFPGGVPTYNYPAVTFVNSTTLKVSVSAAEIASPGALQIYVENFPSGWNGCAIFGYQTFLVSQGTGGGTPAITATPTSITFKAKQAVGTTSASQPVTIKNTGSGSTSVTISASGDFSQTNNCSTLNAGANCTVNVSFAPTGIGSISGAITITDTAANSPQLVSLTGTGIAPLSFSPTSLAFGSVAVGTSSAAKSVTLTNNSSNVLSLTQSISGNYSITGTGTTCGATLAANSTCKIAIIFTPTAKAIINGALTIADGAAFSPQNVTLSGSGTGTVTAPLKFTPTSAKFTSEVIGTTSAAKTVSVKNVSGSSLTISSVSASGNFNASGCVGPLASNATCTLNITFSPSISGSIKGAVTINNSAVVNQQVLGISGTAVLPVTLSPTSLTFATQTVGTTSAAQTVTLTNNQNTILSSLSIAASGDFAIAPGGSCTTTVPANVTCTFNVTFSPSTTGAIKGAVTVTDSASGSPQTLKLTGTGQ
ncbi:MAG TPA: choice-of-anchor D domain-containing protein [Terriglobales bacterium]|nr:choice-of-anchor D domain-containing protein [Terriglobales bacterium]